MSLPHQKTAENSFSTSSKKSSWLMRALTVIAGILALIGPKIIDNLEKVLSIVSNSLQLYSSSGGKKPEGQPLPSLPDLLPPFQESDLPKYQVDYRYYDTVTKQWTDTVITGQSIVVRKAVFQLLDHQVEYLSTFTKLNSEISKLMAHATPVTDYFSHCIDQEKAIERPSKIHADSDKIEDKLAGIFDNLPVADKLKTEGASVVDAGEATDGFMRDHSSSPDLILSTDIKLNKYGLISILLEYTRNCNRLDGGSTIFRDAINVNLALPEFERFTFDKMTGLNAIFRDCHNTDKVVVFSAGGSILCYARSEVLNTNRQYEPKEHDKNGIYNQLQDPILKYQFDRLMKLPDP